MSVLTISHDESVLTCKTNKSATFFAKMADLANSCDPKCRILKFWIEGRPFWLEWVVSYDDDFIRWICLDLQNQKKSATFLQKMADSANSCDSKCRTCKFWVESRPFWLKRVVGRLYTRYMSRPAKPKKVSQFLAKMTD